MPAKLKKQHKICAKPCESKKVKPIESKRVKYSKIESHRYSIPTESLRGIQGIKIHAVSKLAITEANIVMQCNKALYRILKS